MITAEKLVQEFNASIKETHPHIWNLLRHCYVKALNPVWVRHYVADFHYLGIYCPSAIFADVLAEKELMREVAKSLGLTEVICINATSLLHDPLSILKQVHPQLWLELVWIVTQE
ncbi:hypothetical protein B6N60_00120 [Richelia sinica FACHB-800]|uniref:Uncharacterized protein n=1 Tax=Richelia sinica FACHB-800 TaxID=1357546 RepID=A0A975T4V7_9NOST|nr:hypothetical protein [Richelia sinica]MBD2665281.1 hypothetical protein [Richelia sinica FACHB-800]QXE21446.1 hypothetical protein B6N60_00120 [Richelia sinica FACHB-800]